MILPEDSAEAFEKVCLCLEYECVGTPVSEDDVTKFDTYRKSGEVGTVIVASVPRPYATCIKLNQCISCFDACCRWCSHQPLKGTLRRSDGSERRWEKDIVWAKPRSESSKCWFVANAGVEDKGMEVKFLHRSLATLKVHLKNTRVATTKRIKDEYEHRRNKNREAIEVLEANSQLWNLVGGPCVEYLAEPCDEALDKAHEAKELLLKIRAQKDAPGNAAQIAHDMIKAVNAFATLDFERIRREKFPMTPETMFEGFVKNMKELHSERKLAAEDSRRQKWLSAGAGEDDDEGSIANFACTGADRFGCNPDAFSSPSSKQKPKGFTNAVLKASLVHIDEMRTLLEMHYDDMHFAKHIRSIQGRGGEERVVTKRRKSDFKVFRSVVNSHKRRLCQRIDLPDQVYLLRNRSCVV